MTSVLRPHKDVVTDMSISRDGEILCSVGRDQLVWFFQIQRAEKEQDDVAYIPIGFFQCEHEIRSVDWRTDKVVLVACGTQAIEIDLPSDIPALALLTKESFDLTKRMTSRVFQFERKPKVNINFESKSASSASNPAAAIKSGGDDDEDEEEEEIPASQVFCAAYKRTGLIDEAFHISLDGPDQGFLYECKMDSPFALDDIPHHAVTSRKHRYSKSGNLLLSGGSDGSVLVRSNKVLDYFVRINVHDNQYGEITDVTSSFDDNYILSVDAYGCFFSTRLRYDELEGSALRARDLGQPLVKGASANIQSMRVAIDARAFQMVASSVKTDKHDESHESKQIEPIDPFEEDPDAYCLEDEKRRKELDHQVHAADIKKQSVRQAIRGLREKFKALKNENNAAPSPEKLEDGEFIIDPVLRETYLLQGKEKVEEARKEMRYESERKTILKKKLMEKYVNDLEVQSIELKAFRTGLRLQCFRTPKLSKDLKNKLETVREILDAESDARDRALKAPEHEAQRLAEAAAEAFSNGDFENAKTLRQKTAKSKYGAGAKKYKGGVNDAEDNESDGLDAVSHRADVRKRMRQIRKAKMAALERAKPALDDEDQNDVAVINWVKRNVGDYKLKTAKDYVVPESMRINAEKKRQQLILLEESIFQIEMEMNDKFLQLRDLKKDIIESVATDSARLKEIYEELGQEMPELEVR